MKSSLLQIEVIIFKLIIIFVYLHSFALFSQEGMQSESWVSVDERESRLKKDVWPYLRPEERREAERKWLKEREMWRTNIFFEGKVLDDDGRGVHHAGVKIEVRDGGKAGSVTHYCETDARGVFELDGVTGKSMFVKIFHPGYYMYKNNPCIFEFGDKSSPQYYNLKLEGPAIFKAKKRGISEPLIVQELDLDLEGTGQILGIDLLSGNFGDTNLYKNVDLILEFNKSQNSVQDPEFNLTLTTAGGGLQITTDDFMFRAPKDGYKDKLVLKKGDFENPDKMRQGYQYLMFRNKNGNYAKIKIEVKKWPVLAKGEADSNKIESGKIWIQYLLNPSASDNLEFETGNVVEVNDLVGDGIRMTFPNVEDISGLRKLKEKSVGKYKPDALEMTMDYFPR